MRKRTCEACGNGPPAVAVRDLPMVRYGGVPLGPLCRYCEGLWLRGWERVTPPRWVYVPGTPGIDYQALPGFQWVLDAMIEFAALKRPKGEKP